MKFIKILIIGLIFTGCSDEFLNPTPISSLEEVSSFDTDDEVLAGIIGMYDAIQGVNIENGDFDNIETSGGIQYEFALTEMRSDNSFMRDPEGEFREFNTWIINPTNSIVANYYKSFYEIIFRANKVLQFVNNADEDNVAAYEAEAKFVRAYAYFNLVRLFGDIPLLETIEDAETDARFTRIATSDVYQFIIDDLKNIDDNVLLDNTFKSRASLAGAQALLAKVYLTVGEYDNAKAVCDKIIDSNQFELQENYSDIFYDELNDEVIFSVGYLSDNEDESQGFSSLWSDETNGINNLTGNLVGAFTLDEGSTRAQFSYTDAITSSSGSEFAKYLARGVSDLGIAPSAINGSQAGNDWIIFRYADVYLMYVEALLGDNNVLDVSASDPDIERAKFCFEEIRRRAGVLNFEVDEITKQQLLNERRLEFAGENHRFFDLLRFDEAQTTLDAYAIEIGVIFSEFDLLLPIPDREITLGGGLMQQNEGYN